MISFPSSDPLQASHLENSTQATALRAMECEPVEGHCIPPPDTESLKRSCDFERPTSGNVNSPSKRPRTQSHRPSGGLGSPTIITTENTVLTNERHGEPRWHSCRVPGPGSALGGLITPQKPSASNREECQDHNPIDDHSQAPELCVRHQRAATPGDIKDSVHSLHALSTHPISDQHLIHRSLSTFAHSPHPTRALILRGLLSMCCYSQLTLLREHLVQRGLGVVDPFIVLPRELAMRVLGYLDAKELCIAARVCRAWKLLAEDDVLWKEVYERKFGKRPWWYTSGRSSGRTMSGSSVPSNAKSQSFLTGLSLQGPERRPPSPSPADWKVSFRKHIITDQNWAQGTFTSIDKLEGHTGAVTCLQFSSSTSTLDISSSNSAPLSPAILITGSDDCTLCVWNLDTNGHMSTLRGHTGPVRALQFDRAKLISGGLDGSMKVWDWRQGRCVRTLVPLSKPGTISGGEGGLDGPATDPGPPPSPPVLCLQFDEDVLVSGGVDGLVRVWDLRTRSVWALREHQFGNTGSIGPHHQITAIKIWKVAAFAGCGAEGRGGGGEGSDTGSTEDVEVKHLLSASTDGCVRLWDLRTKNLLRVYSGHLAMVTSMAVIGGEGKGKWKMGSSPGPVVFSGSLDSSIRVWDAETGWCIEKFLGHRGAVSTLATDGVRVVSGSYDGTIKMWDSKGHCMATFAGHWGKIYCLGLGEDKIVAGGENGEIRIWNFF